MSECMRVESYRGRVVLGIGAHPDDLEPLLSQIAAALQRKDPLVESDQRLRLRDGSYRTFHNAVRYRYDGEGKPTTFLGVAIDITHRTPEPAGGVVSGFTT